MHACMHAFIHTNKHTKTHTHRERERDLKHILTYTRTPAPIIQFTIFFVYFTVPDETKFGKDLRDDAQNGSRVFVEDVT